MIEAILARFGYHRRTWDRPNGHRDSDAVAKAHRWMNFYNEEGGIGDLIAAIRKEYFEAIGSLVPGNTAGLEALAMADLIARKLDGAIKLIIETGDLERRAQEHAAKIAALPLAQRRRL